MPRREDIERFKQVLNSLGSEPEIRAGKSETIEDVAPPAEGASEDINALLGDIAQTEEAQGEEQMGDLSGEGLMGLVDADMAEGPGAEETPLGAALSEEEPGAAGQESGLDFGSLFGEEAEPPAIEDIENEPKKKRAKERKKKAERPAKPEGKKKKAPLEEPAPEEPPSTEEGLPSFGGEGLPDLGGEAGFGETLGGEATVPGEESFSLEGLPGFGEEPAPGEEPGLPAPDFGGEPGAAQEPLGEEEAFGYPEGESAELQSDLAQMEIIPEEAGFEAQPEAPAAGEEELPEEIAQSMLTAPFGEEAVGEEPALEGAEASELGEMSFADIGEEAGPGAQAAESPEAGEFAGFEDLGSLEAGEAMAPAEEEAPQAAGEEEPSAGGFELPSLEDMSGAGATEQGLEGMDLGALPEEPSPEGAGEPDLSQLPEEPSAAPDLGAISEEPSLEGLELGAEPQAAEQPAAEPSAPMESLGEESLGDLNFEDFAAPGGAEGFEMPAAEEPAPPPRRETERKPRPAAAQKKAAAPAEEAPAAEEQREFSLTREQFARLRKALDFLPRNLKLAVEEVIGSGAAEGAMLRKLVSLLIAGATAAEIAAVVGQITGKKIRIPAGYEKKTGIAFEEEQRSFAYAFRTNILPLLRIFLLAAIIGGALAYVGYKYVYTPVYAILNYRQGYAHISNDRFSLANERFARATKAWPMKDWFYRYAEGFAGKRQYPLAEEKYRDILSRWPGDHKGALDYARMESVQLANYPKAEDILKKNILEGNEDDIKKWDAQEVKTEPRPKLVKGNPYDYDGLIAAGDNYIEWGEKDGARYEMARLAYASAIEKYGMKDDILFRMLRYFIRVEKDGEVERLRKFFLAKKDLKVNAEVFAELGGYLIDHNRLDFVKDVLHQADKAKTSLPEIHYNLARYYRLVQQPDMEKAALETTLRRLKPTDALTAKRLFIEIDTHTRLGELAYVRKEYIEAEKQYTEAITRIEDNQKKGIVGAEQIFGRAYADMADLRYYIQGELALALPLYEKAIANRSTGPGQDYKIGFIHYAQKNYKAAIASFMKAEDAAARPSTGAVAMPVASVLPPAEAAAPAAPVEAGQGAGGEAAAPQAAPPAVLAAPPGQVAGNILFALGNSFYQRGDYFAAQGYYLRLLDRLTLRKAALGANQQPQENPDYRSLLENLMKVNNNLGVTLVKLSERTGDRRKRSQALAYFSNAAEISDVLTRNPDTMVRTEAKNLPFLNSRGVLYPISSFDLQIYSQLPIDREALFY